ncbi:MAG: RNA polymerase sigma factor, partial [Ilumatobacteraceae bacterium]
MSDAYPESSRVPITESSKPNSLAWAGSEAVYGASYRNLLRVAFVLTGSAQAAEDVVHDVFAKVGPRIDTLAEPAAYLRVAVVNRCRSLHRRDVAAPRPDQPADAVMDLGLVE